MSQRKSKKFALIGAAGYIAPKHMRVIKETGNELVAALDPFDSVGILDQYFPEADFFTEPERFDRYLDKKRKIPEEKIDYVSICSPNYLHDAHIRMALRNEAHAICEKPLVLNPWNLDALKKIEEDTGKNIYTILQLRYHHSIIKLKKEVESGPKDKIYNVDFKYTTPRGKWYEYSWKGDINKSGGLATNIGIHFFDLLLYIFGDCKKCIVHQLNEKTNSGSLELEKANVNWILSIDNNNIAEKTLNVDNCEIDISKADNDLYYQTYNNILKKEGIRIKDIQSCIGLVNEIRNFNLPN